MRFLKRTVSNIIGTALFLFLVLGTVAAGLAIWHPDSPLPDEWNPTRPLTLTDPVTPITHWKLSQVTAGPACLTALADTGAVFDRLEDLVEDDKCHIRDRVRVRNVAGVSLRPVETRCETALKLTYWVQHEVQPSADITFGEPVREIEHFSSYVCRPINTPSGPGTRMSKHASAEAIDISGVVLSSGVTVSLLGNWTGTDSAAAFMRKAQMGACKWFTTVLGPDFNALHADHFHMQTSGWGSCR